MTTASFILRARWFTPLLLVWCAPVLASVAFLSVTAEADRLFTRAEGLFIGVVIAVLNATGGAGGFLAALAVSPRIWVRSQRALNVTAAVLGLSLIPTPWLIGLLFPLSVDRHGLGGAACLIVAGPAMVSFAISLPAILVLLRARLLMPVPAPGTCMACGYKLAASVSRCSECGHQAAPSKFEWLT